MLSIKVSTLYLMQLFINNNYTQITGLIINIYLFVLIHVTHNMYTIKSVSNQFFLNYGYTMEWRDKISIVCSTLQAI